MILGHSPIDGLERLLLVGVNPHDRWIPHLGTACPSDSHIVRHETKRLAAFEAIDREVRSVRREHGRAIELFGQRDERGVREVHRRISVLVQQLSNAHQ